MMGGGATPKAASREQGMAGVSPFPELVDGLPGPNQPQVPPGDLLGVGRVPAQCLDLLPEQGVLLLEGFDLLLQVRPGTPHLVELEQAAIPEERQEEQEPQETEEEEQAGPRPSPVRLQGICPFGRLRAVAPVKPLRHHRPLNGRKASTPGKRAAAPNASSMRRSWLYLAVRSVRDAEPALIWPAFTATARSAIVTSSVSPER